jgi:hypothetical protein
VSAGFDRDTVIEQHWNFSAELVLRLGIRNRDLCPAGLQEQSRGHSGLPQADHENAFVGEIHKCSFWLLASGF